MRHVLSAALIVLTATAAPGADAPKGDAPKAADPKAVDRALYDTLRDVHDRGAALYNGGDPAGSYRLFQGALRVARAALAHRPDQQKAIDIGLIEADRQRIVERRAFHLHELIEKVRADIRPDDLKPDVKKPEPTPPKMPAPKPKPPKDYEPLPTRPREVGPELKKPPLLKEGPKDGPREVQPPKPMPDKNPFAGKRTAGVAGRVMVKGKPVPGVAVTFVTRDQMIPRVYEATSGTEGLYLLGGVKPGRYTVLLAPGAQTPPKVLPERYALTTTSPLVIDVKPGGDSVDFLLQ
jgi:hypothetical protein